MRQNFEPLVSVIIATYNYSSVLRCAIQSVLGQTFSDFELLVIGDGCTDDSEAVVASFADDRIRWHNLPENTGYQAAPNNTGLAMARGRYAAYLGHDDLWLPHHLARLTECIEETGADVAYSLCIMIAPPGSPVRVLTGATKSGVYEPGALVVPSSILHRTGMAQEIGGWRDYREFHTPADIAFLSAAWAARKRFTSVRDVTVLKFPAPWRKDVYKTKPSFEQESYLRRLNDPSLLTEELTALALAFAEGNIRDPIDLPSPPPGAPAGWMVDEWRKRKGLPRLEGERAILPIYLDPEALRTHNRECDIVPPEGVAAIRCGNDLPADGIFLGRGWHGLEFDGDQAFRWLDTEGELILTNISQGNSALVLDLESGPSRRCEPIELALTNEEGVRMATATASYRHPIRLQLPENLSGSSVFRLTTPGGGMRIPGDTRILNLRVFQIRWAQPPLRSSNLYGI